MKVSFFRGGASDTRPVLLELDWEQWVAMFEKNGHALIPNVGPDPASQKAAKVSQPCFCPTEFANHNRQNANALWVHFAVVDFDHAEASAIKEVARKLEADGIAYLIYTSWSHTDTNLSLRLMMPLDRPVPGSQWPRFWLRLNTYVNGLADPQCKDASRPYFLPACPVERAAHRFIFSHKGKPLVVDSLDVLPVSSEVLTSSKVLRPVEREELSAFAKKLTRTKPDVGHALAKVLRGEPWAPQGHRDNVLFELAGFLAREFPRGDPASLAVHFEQACSHFPDFTTKDVAYKVQRRQEEIARQEEQKLEVAANQRKLSIQIALGPERTHPYTKEELEALTQKLGVTPDALLKRWIIQRGGGIYLLCAGEYLGPWPIADCMLAAHTYLAPSTSAGLRLEEITAFGEFQRRSIQSLALDYGTPALHTLSDLTAQETYFDAMTKTIVEAPAKRRPLLPTFNPDVDRWLRALGGGDYLLLEQWLAWITELRLPCAALFIEGPPGCGKSLLAKGLARIWTVEGPTALGQVLTGTFNQALEKCPLVFGDERLPKTFAGKGTTGELREFIQADVRPLTRKYQPDATLRGAARVLIAANNHAILEGEDNLSPWDIEAIVSRIVHIKVRDLGADTATTLLAKLGAVGVTANWVTHDIIARHVLWMVDNVPRTDNPPRFLVQQESSSLHKALATNTNMGSAVAHWLVLWVMDPSKVRSYPDGDPGHYILVHKGRLFVHPRAIAEHWEAYETNVRKDRAAQKAISKALHGISTGKNQTLNPRGEWYKYKVRWQLMEIRWGDLCEWAKSTGFCTPAELITQAEKLNDNPDFPCVLPEAYREKADPETPGGAQGP